MNNITLQLYKVCRIIRTIEITFTTHLPHGAISYISIRRLYSTLATDGHNRLVKIGMNLSMQFIKNEQILTELVDKYRR